MALPPVPFKTNILNPTGFLTNAWAAWFRDLYEAVVNASIIDAAASAAAAAASAVSSAASAVLAQSYLGSATASAAAASASASGALGSASAAVDSANSAAASAVSAAASASQQAYPYDYIEIALTVPVHRQFIAFQRVTVASGGSLCILGRGRIL